MNVKLWITCVLLDLPIRYAMDMGIWQVWYGYRYIPAGTGMDKLFVLIDYTSMSMVLLYPAHTVPLPSLRCTLIGRWDMGIYERKQSQHILKPVNELNNVGNNTPNRVILGGPLYQFLVSSGDPIRNDTYIIFCRDTEELSWTKYKRKALSFSILTWYRHAHIHTCVVSLRSKYHVRMHNHCRRVFPNDFSVNHSWWNVAFNGHIYWPISYAIKVLTLV